MKDEELVNFSDKDMRCKNVRPSHFACQWFHCEGNFTFMILAPRATTRETRHAIINAP